MKFLFFSLAFICAASSFQLSYTGIKHLKTTLKNPYRDLKVSPLDPMNKINEKYKILKEKYNPGKEQQNIEKYDLIEESYQKIIKERIANGINESNEDLLSLLLNRLGKASLDTIILLLILIPLNVFVFTQFKLLEKYFVYIVVLIIVYDILDRVFPHYFHSEFEKWAFIILIWAVLMFQNKFTDYIFDNYFAKKKPGNQENFAKKKPEKEFRESIEENSN